MTEENIEALRRDAARYRMLRRILKGCMRASLPTPLFRELRAFPDMAVTGETLDTAVDNIIKVNT